jgi:hypothetical protein
MEVFVENFSSENGLTPIDIVMEVTGFTYPEILKSDIFKVVIFDYDENGKLIEITN